MANIIRKTVEQQSQLYLNNSPNALRWRKRSACRESMLFVTKKKSMLATANHVHAVGNVPPYKFWTYHACPRQANPAAVMTLGATCSGMRSATRSNIFLVARWVKDLSCMVSVQWLKVRFSAALRNSSSHPSVVMLSSMRELLRSPLLREGDILIVGGY